MRILNLLQGSEDWLAHRRTVDFTSSDAAPALNFCKNTTRNEMIHAKATGETKEIDRFTQKLFDDGHAAENAMRPIIEEMYGCSFFPVCGEAEVDGLMLMASLDGLSYDDDSFDADIIYEHKIYNKALFDSVLTGVVPPTHTPQLDHLLKVSDAKRVIFVVSDGTLDNMAKCEYTGNEGLFSSILNAYRQVTIDIENYTPAPKKEVVIAAEQSDLPALNCSVEGSMVISNLAEYIPVIKELAREQMAIVLDTDQDFADKEAFNKKVKSARATLKASATDIEAKFTSLADFNGYVKEADSILQKLQSHGEKQVKESKELKKLSLMRLAGDAIEGHVSALNESLGYPYIRMNPVFWKEIIKGKRNFESMQNALDSEVANQKIELNKQADLIRENLATLKELSGDYRPLFADHAMLVRKSNDDLTNLIKARINEHDAAEKAKAEQLREQIRREEEAKAKREADKKLAVEREVIKQKEAQSQQEAKAKAERERAKIRAEEKARADNERDQLIKEAEKTPVKPEVAKPPTAQAKKATPEVAKTTPEAACIYAQISNDGDGYSLYMDGEYVGYIEEKAFTGEQLIITKTTKSQHKKQVAV